MIGRDRRLSLCIRYWDYCNNDCKFCFEKNKSFDGMFGKPSIYAIEENNKCVKSLVDHNKYNYFTFKILGGELFAIRDFKIALKIADTIEYFYEVFDKSGMLDRIQCNQTIPETLVIASNLLYRDPTALYMSLDKLKKKRKTNASMMVSYDLYGRFNTSLSLELYRRNYLDIFNNYNDVVRPVISFIMTKLNINMLADQTKCRELDVFDELYHLNAPFDMTLLLNDSHVDSFAYSRSDLDKFIDIILSKYPRLISVFLDKSNHMKFKNISERHTIQGGRIVDETSLFDMNEKTDCLLCSQYNRCKHTFSEISYNAYDCDVKEILDRCENY